jgi:RNA-directed DNA polymerase
MCERFILIETTTRDASRDDIQNGSRKVKKLCAVKGGDFQWVQSPPGDGSPQPVAIGAWEEVTNPTKPLMERIALGGSASVQAELNANAKGSKGYRFYVLYDKVYRADVIGHAYGICRFNGGSAGVEGQTFADIEGYGRERWLDELAEELRTMGYRPEAVRRVYIPKPGKPNRTRPLGIPTIKDRVAMTAAMLVLEPIFEADLPPEQYAYRWNRSALDTVRRVHTLLKTRHWEVVGADLSGYLDNIPHFELMKLVARRISDGRMLRLIKMWLDAPMEETDERGNKHRTTRNKDEGRGSPQGAPISPLLANLYMRRFILGWKVLGHEKRFQSEIVNYADDFVICCGGQGELAMDAMRGMMRTLKLTVNDEKTHLCRLPDESFDFLGYAFGRCYSETTGRRYIGQRPSTKKIRAVCRQVSEWTGGQWCWLDAGEQVGRINQMLVGWASYFCQGPVTKAYRRITQHARERLRRWLCKKHKRQGHGYTRYPDDYLHNELGLIQLRLCDRNVPWANAWDLVRELDAGNPHIQFDERGVETELGDASEALADGRASNR